MTIGNASAAPMLAHVNVFNERTELVLDFNIALTGFDIQSFSVASVLRGNLPITPINVSHVPEVKDGLQVTINGDVCQRNPAAPVYPAAGGYLRVRPTSPATGLDNTLATVVPGWSARQRSCLRCSTRLTTPRTRRLAADDAGRESDSRVHHDHHAISQTSNPSDPGKIHQRCDRAWRTTLG